MATNVQRGRIDALGDLAGIDLLQFNGGVNPYPDRSVLNTFRRSPQRYRDKVQASGIVGLPRVLDVGCGHGRWSMFLAEVNDAVEGIERNEGAVRIARGMAKLFELPNATFTVGDVGAMPYEDASFDAAWVSAVMQFVDRDACLREVQRVLKPGGTLFVSSYNGLGRWLEKYLDGHREGGRRAEKTRLCLGVIERGPHHGGRPNYIASSVIEGVLARHGFHLDERVPLRIQRKGETPPELAGVLNDHAALARALTSDKKLLNRLLAEPQIAKSIEYNLEFVALRS